MAAGPTGYYYVKFDNEDLWHARRSFHATAGGHIIVTPDGDVYEELLVDCEDIAPAGARCGPPSRISRKPRYNFAAADLHHNSDFMVRASAEADQVVQHAGGQAAGLAAGAAAAAGGGADGIVPAGGGAAPLAPVIVGPGASLWFLLEDAFGATMGSPITVLATDRTAGEGGRAVLIRGGVAACISTTAPAAASAAAATDDLRTLALRFDQRGVRSRTFAEAAASFSETAAANFPLSGPRTMLWLALEMAKGGMSPSQRHEWWRQMLGVSAADAGVDEHAFLSDLLELGGGFDQCNLSELAVFEAVARRYQLWEERYGEKLRSATEGSAAAGGMAYERSLFLGGQARHRGALVSPALQRWIADRMGEDSAVLKERRKGREERELLASATGSGNSTGGGRANGGKKGGQQA